MLLPVESKKKENKPNFAINVKSLRKIKSSELTPKRKKAIINKRLIKK